MANIELAIKIPKELYYLVQNKLDFNGDLDKQMVKTLMLAIDNGTPLPKGHAKLIDADKLKQKIEMADDNIMEEDWYKLYENVISDIDNAYPIIKADTESEK